MARANRSFVPFTGLWSMPIDVPYSFLVRDREHAWTCGQLDLDDRGGVRHPGDLLAQSKAVACNLLEIVGRADLEPSRISRLALYHAPADTETVTAMLAEFRTRVGAEVLLDPIPVPHFYYPGVMLEVDLFWGDAELDWVSAGADAIPATELLSLHCIAPTNRLAAANAVPDPGAVIDGGPTFGETRILGCTVPGSTPTTDVTTRGGVTSVVSRAGRFAWTQGRVDSGPSELVPQTESIMSHLDQLLPRLGLSYGDVVKSTTHYVGGTSADELHDNMAVRNRRYESPGPASTGLPVYGFADAASRVVIDLTLTSPLPAEGQPLPS